MQAEACMELWEEDAGPGGPSAPVSVGVGFLEGASGGTENLTPVFPEGGGELGGSWRKQDCP